LPLNNFDNEEIDVATMLISIVEETLGFKKVSVL